MHAWSLQATSLLTRCLRPCSIDETLPLVLAPLLLLLLLLALPLLAVLLVALLLPLPLLLPLLPLIVLLPRWGVSCPVLSCLLGVASRHAWKSHARRSIGSTSTFTTFCCCCCAAASAVDDM